MSKRRILIVCMWPLGGIRTYLKYNYRHFPKDEFEITLLANRSIEARSLEEDMAAEGIEVIWSEPFFGKNVLFYRVWKQTKTGKYDLIHAQGFISAIHVSLVNRCPRLPHLFTLHGVLEKKRFTGWLGGIKKWLLQVILKNVTIVHGVGDDILTQIRSDLPKLDNGKRRWVVIKNGIETLAFTTDIPGAGATLRQDLSLAEDAFVCGYFGRFMPEKGFEFLIEAIKILSEAGRAPSNLIVMAVGSGDFEKRYKARVTQYELDPMFRFLPFNPQIATLIQGCDVVVIPSIWEAYPLLSSEILCSGRPLIATDCSGLREAVKGTPAMSVPSGDAQALADAIEKVILNPEIEEDFKSYRDEAAKRFDVSRMANELVELIRREAT